MKGYVADRKTGGIKLVKNDAPIPEINGEPEPALVDLTQVVDRLSNLEKTVEELRRGSKS